MPTLLIGYDLNGAKDYQALYSAIKSVGSAWWHHLDSTWLINTTHTPVAVRDLLKRHLDADDELLVIDVSGDLRAWTGFNQRAAEWLHQTYQARS